MIVADVQSLIRSHYVFPQVAAAIEHHLAGLVLDGIDEAEQAVVLTDVLQSVNGDKHLRVQHYPDGVPPNDDEQAMRSWFVELARTEGPGVREVRRLEGNVGVIVLGPVICLPEHFAPAAAAAFTLLEGVEQLVIDVRTCRGGVPESVALLVSHFCGDEPIHLQDLVARDGTAVATATTPSVSPKLPSELPVDVLTSGRTFSGGEELAYDLQALGRARIVGERTGGGAHPREAFDLSPHLQLHIPTARSVNAVTGTNWEGTGVVPDLACAAGTALETCLNSRGVADTAEPGAARGGADTAP